MTGLFEIAAAIYLRRVIGGEWLLAPGVVSVTFGVLLAVRPGACVLAVLWLRDSYVVLFGLLLMALAFRLLGRGARLIEIRAASWR